MQYLTPWVQAGCVTALVFCVAITSSAGGANPCKRFGKEREVIDGEPLVAASPTLCRRCA